METFFLRRPGKKTAEREAERTVKKRKRIGSNLLSYRTDDEEDNEAADVDLNGHLKIEIVNECDK